MVRKLTSLLIILIASNCVDRIAFEGIQNVGVLVVDGQITDQPGPYIVKIFSSSSVNDKLNFASSVPTRQVTIFDDIGNTENLSQVEDHYETSASGIRGKIGRKYAVRIELLDGSIYESQPDELKPVGNIDSLYTEFESILPLTGPTEYGFKVFIDSQNLTEQSSYVRWTFTGTYKVETYPELHIIIVYGNPYPAPRACSGVTYAPQNYFKTVAPCSCCECWVNQFENQPVVKDNALVSNGAFKKIEMGYVPLNEWTFYDKYLIEIQQMSLSQQAYNYWKTVQDQKEGSESLFQPAIGKLKTNIFDIAGKREAFGLFYASSVKRKTLFLTGEDVPVLIPVPEIKIPESCLTAFPNSTTEKPADWP